MKKKIIGAMIPLTFGLLMLAGCSSDEKEVDNGLQGLKSSDMIVSLEELTSDEEEDASTRSFMSRDMKTHMWVEDDEMRVYDPLMVRYDIYKFGYKDDSRQTGVFSRVMEESFYSEAPTFAFFSNQDVEGGYFDRDRTTYEPFLSAKFYISADMNGSQPMAFATTQSGGTTFFSDWLPRWGEVTKVEDGQALHTSMKFLTGVLRLQLANTGGKADLVKVQMLSGGTKALDIAGIFTTKLSINNVIQENASLTQESYKKRSGGKDILVNLTGASGSVVVYVPLVTTSVPVDIVCSASADGGSTWTEFKRFKNKTVTRGKVYGNSVEYDFAE